LDEDLSSYSLSPNRYPLFAGLGKKKNLEKTQPKVGFFKIMGFSQVFFQDVWVFSRVVGFFKIHEFFQNKIFQK
jgi:hypothetical protein